jgi:hypothetical protein
MTSKPTLILVHGAWHRETMWKQLIQELPDVDVRTIQLPSSAPVPVAQLGDLYDDARTIRNIVTFLSRPAETAALLREALATAT